MAQVNQESNTIYLGHGKTATGPYGEFFNITLNLNKVNEHPHVIEEYMDTKYIKLRVTKKSEVDEYGRNVMVSWWDTSKIQNEKEPTQTKKLPF